MNTEFQSLSSNTVWELVPLPKDGKVISSEWVFKCKGGEHGLIERYKARLVTQVAQGYSQRPELDYDELFSPVVRFESVGTLAALAAQDNLKLHQMDVTTAS